MHGSTRGGLGNTRSQSPKYRKFITTVRFKTFYPPSKHADAEIPSASGFRGLIRRERPPDSFQFQIVGSVSVELSLLPFHSATASSHSLEIGLCPWVKYAKRYNLISFAWVGSLEGRLPRSSSARSIWGEGPMRCGSWEFPECFADARCAHRETASAHPGFSPRWCPFQNQSRCGRLSVSGLASSAEFRCKRCRQPLSCRRKKMPTYGAGLRGGGCLLRNSKLCDISI